MSSTPPKRSPIVSRRSFLGMASATATGLSMGGPALARPKREVLALAGGPRAVHYERPSEAWRWPLYDDKARQAVATAIENPGYGDLETLEKEWREFSDAPYVKAHCNGTSALTSMFFALDLPPGSEIMVPSYTFFATIVPMRLFGLVPVFVDIHPRTLNFDLEDATRRLTQKTRALLPVHWIGLPCDMDQICNWAKEKDLIVLEDAAHAHGVELQGKQMGNWGRMSIFSYQMSKPLPAMEGGMGVYQHQDDYERATTFGHSGVPAKFPETSEYRKYIGTGLGTKLRIHPMAAALVRCQLPGFNQQKADGVAQVRQLNDRLLHLPGLYEQSSGRADIKRLHYFQNMLFIDEALAGMSRAAVVKALQAEGVQTSEFSYRLQHQQPLYRNSTYWHHLPVIPQLPGCDQANATALPLPYFTSHVPELVDQYVRAFEKVWAHRDSLGKS
jgi:perosamine synthetase